MSSSPAVTVRRRAAAAGARAGAAGARAGAAAAGIAGRAAAAAKFFAVEYSIWLIIGVLVLMIILWIVGKHNLEGTDGKNCTNMDTLYSDFPPISSVNASSDKYSYSLRDYYIKTAYNCCSAGEYKNDFVNTCALENCIRAGARCLDFEVYSVKNAPVIAVSSFEDYHTKESYNSVPFGDAMATIASHAFSSGTTTCNNDPLIIHLRIKSRNKQIYKQITKDIYDNLENYLLGKEYSYENHGKNLGQTKLKELMKKVIIIVDNANPLFSETPLNEYVNITSNSVFMRALQYHDVKFTHNMDELIGFNKKNMTICLPDLTATTNNPSASVAMAYGCQMVAMSFQNFDANMEYMAMFFDEAGSAFALKPERLRYIPITVPDPKPQNPAYSYATRNVSSDFYSFNI